MIAQPGRRRADDLIKSVVCLVATISFVACSPDAPRPTPTVPPGGVESTPVAIAVVGDIACGAGTSTARDHDVCAQHRVARTIDLIDPDHLVLLGDLQYPDAAGVVRFGPFDRSFGPFRDRTIPVPGDAEWVEGRNAYFEYFGDSASPPGGYSSMNVGAWHVIALNSQDCFDDDGCGPGTPQYEWLRADLAAAQRSETPCTLAAWHDPRFLWVSWWTDDGAPRGPQPRLGPFWRLLELAGTDVVLGGNAHNYERWSPQDASGAEDPAGITQFVVGTGGRRLNAAGPHPRPPLLEAFQAEAFGVLELSLAPGSFAWRWRSAPGEPRFRDSGSASCH